MSLAKQILAGGVDTYTAGDGINITTENIIENTDKGSDVDLSGKIDIDGRNSNVDYINFNILAEDFPLEEGRLHWNSNDGTLNIDMPGGKTQLQIGQELLIRVRNNSGIDIPNGSVVYISGSTGNRPEIKLADASDYNKTFVLGLSTEFIENAHFGFVCMEGLVRGIDTNKTGAFEGCPIWLSTTPGEFTCTQPEAPNINVFIGYIIRKHTTEGLIATRPVVIPRLQALSDVNGFELTESGQIIVWNETEKYFNPNYNINDYVTNDVLQDGLKEPTGFEDRDQSTISFSVDGTTNRALFTITPTYTEYNIWFAGTKISINTEKSILLPDINGLHIIYFDNDGILKSVNEPSDQEINIIIKDKCIVSLVYWDATNKIIVYDGEERHGTVMDGTTHSYLHLTKGMAWISGLALGDFLIGNGGLDTHAQFGVELGNVKDEDISLNIDAVTSTTGLPILYREGITGNWRRLEQTGFSCYRGTNTRISYNNYNIDTWELIEAGNNDFVLYHIFATTGYNNSVFSIMGQNIYGNAPSAREGANKEISDLLLGGLPTPEITPIASVIYQTGNYGNTVNARVIQTEEGENYVDWRSSDLPRGTAPTDHGNLTGLQNDHHLQYLRTDGTRNITGIISYNENKTFTGDNELISKNYVDNLKYQERVNTWTYENPYYTSTINHNLGIDFPNVTCWGYTNRQVIVPKIIESIDTNNIKIYFNDDGNDIIVRIT